MALKPKKKHVYKPIFAVQAHCTNASVICPQYFVGKMHAISDGNWFLQRKIYRSLRNKCKRGRARFSHFLAPLPLPKPCARLRLLHRVKLV